MSHGDFELNKGGNLKKPQYNLICKQILEVWKDIPSEMIIKSFKKCGISNALDGTEDDLLYSSDAEISEDEIDDLNEIVNEDDVSAEELELDK